LACLVRRGTGVRDATVTRPDGREPPDAPDVLHVIESNGPGGAETILVDLVTRASGTGRGRAIVPSEDGWLGRTLAPERRYVVAPTPRERSGPIDLAFIRGIRKVVRSAQPVIVHAHSFDAAVYAALATVGLPVRLVATFHGASDVERRGWRNRLKWRVLRRVDAIVCVSHSLAAHAGAVPGFPHDVLDVIHNGIAVERFDLAVDPGLRRRLGIPDGTMLFGALGNVRGPKGYDLLLHAVRQLRLGGRAVHLAIAGDDSGDLGESLRRLRADLDLETSVTLLGYVADPAPFLAGIDAFVLPSTSEGFSLATVQAMAAGRAAVVTRCGGPQEIVEHQVSALLVAPGSVSALADAMDDLVTQPVLRERLMAGARARAREGFSRDRMVADYRSLYRRLSTR
jgi:glycosyltransferase involved in cell wall biosynthesis